VLLWLRFLRGTEEGKDKGNSMAFCGWGGLVEKETRRGGGLVGRGCERSGAWRRHDTSAEEAGGGRCGATARSRDRGGGGTLACGTPTQ
jgi:hypothetical protein